VSDVTTILVMVGVGVGAGVVGGLFGIGGGLIIVPALMLGFGLDQRTASGTSLLAQLLPVALLAVLEYGRRGEVRVSWGLGVALGLLFGTLAGARLSGLVRDPRTMKQIYGVFLIAVGIYFLSGWSPRPKPVTGPAEGAPTAEGGGPIPGPAK
jgi:uncharacterized membrane protein YfcA